MLGFITGPIIGILSGTLMLLNLIFWGSLFYVVLIFKVIFQKTALCNFFDAVLVRITESWIYCNGFIYALCFNLTWDIQLPDSLKRKQSYLITANHQSWVDILVLQKMLTGKIPFLRFFIKQELIWIPILGGAWWGLDMPFMKRYSREYLEKNPHMKGKDLETTRKSCEKFKTKPVSVINFFEGTRFTPAKHSKQHSPFTHLLKPKAGGAAFTVDAMGGVIRQLVRVSIVYPNGKTSFKSFLFNHTRVITCRAELIDIPEALIGGDYENDPAFKAQFQAWVNDLWEKEDAEIDALIK